MSTKEKRDARLVQAWRGVAYTTALRWVRLLHDEGLLPAGHGEQRDAGLRAALDTRFPSDE